DDVEDGEVVLAAGRNAVDDDVRDRHVRRGELRLRIGLGGLGGPYLLGQSLRTRQQRRALVGRRGTHALAGGLLFGPQRVGGRDGGPARGVGRQEGVHQRRVFTAAELGAAHGVGVFP